MQRCFHSSSSTEECCRAILHTRDKLNGANATFFDNRAAAYLELGRM
ncbi:hypothetical protein AALP_AA6G328000 [Arabis alpina]|uniref:Uncharacterized protein n=1 Tax=Arabis alpina TaxID=50452 RepID=A0A087GT78_ARAAL|nr:hypothetical protein AALP_AA6G328000 [Arabis alpina]